LVSNQLPVGYEPTALPM